MKDLMRKTLGRATLNYEEMTTVLGDCEAVINSRPLTYVSEDPGEPVAITPALFLTDLPGKENVDFDEVEGSQLTRRARYRREIYTQLRRRFRDEYLGQLVHHQEKAKYRRPVRLGEVVLVGSDDKKRNAWPLGRVVEIFPGGDGHVRRVKVRTQNGVIIRPIQRIYPLEVTTFDESSTASNNESPTASVPEMLPSTASNSESQTASVPEMSPTASTAETIFPAEFTPIKEVVTRMTKAGRVVRTPKKLDLLNLNWFI